MASFRVDTTFRITGRGLVLAGDVAEGRVRIGGRVALPDPAAPGGLRLEHVTGVEMGHGRRDDGTPFGFVGLMLGHLPAAEHEALKARLSPGTVVEVLDPEPAPVEPYEPARPPVRPRRSWWKFWSAT